MAGASTPPSSTGTHRRSAVCLRCGAQLSGGSASCSSLDSTARRTIARRVAPVLYIKPRNTWLAHRRPVPLPDRRRGSRDRRDARLSSSDGTRRACRATSAARGDRRLHHRQRRHPPRTPDSSGRRCAPSAATASVQWGPGSCRATRCPHRMRSASVPSSTASSACRTRPRNLHRDVASLIADVTEFMTLRAGDLLAVGVPENPPLARAGDEIAVEIDGIGPARQSRSSPRNSLRAEIPPMKRARVIFRGDRHTATADGVRPAARRRAARHRGRGRVAAAGRAADDFRRRAQLRRARPRARVRTAAGTAGVPQGSELGRRPPLEHTASGGCRNSCITSASSPW